MSNDSSSILTLSNVTIQRGEFALCEGVNLALQAGQICHLVGANGTGKTTLLMQLAGLLPLLSLSNLEDDALVNEEVLETKPQVQFCGQDSLPIQPVYVSHQLGINQNLTVQQNLHFLLELYGMNATDEDIIQALEWVGLDGYEDVNSYQLSAGQTRRVNLARLSLMTPKHSKLWLLDEPFTALDVQMVADLQARLKAFTLNGGAVLMTSHQPVEVADMVLDLSTYMV